MGLFSWIIWALYVAALITIDHRMRVRRALANGGVDFSDGAPLRYLVLSLVSSFLVLPVYFYATRKRWWAIPLGLVAGVGTGFAAGLTVVLLGIAVRAFT
jgi:hypothetical protein